MISPQSAIETVKQIRQALGTLAEQLPDECLAPMIWKLCHAAEVRRDEIPLDMVQRDQEARARFEHSNQRYGTAPLMHPNWLDAISGKWPGGPEDEK